MEHTDTILENLRFGPVRFDADGIIAGRLAVATAPLPAGKPGVKVCRSDGLACGGISRGLLNGVLACDRASGPLDGRLQRVGRGQRRGSAVLSLTAQARRVRRLETRRMCAVPASRRRYRVRVPINHAAHGFAPGHRVRLSLSTSYWPLAWAPPAPVRFRIWPESLRLRVPVRHGDPSIDARLPEFAEAESAEPPLCHTLRPGEANWLIERDLRRERTTLHVINDQGRWHIPEIDLTLEHRSEEWYSYRADDWKEVIPRGFR